MTFEGQRICVRLQRCNALVREIVAAWRNRSRKLMNSAASAVYRSVLSNVLDALYVRGSASL
jgi:hypothetical protein